MSLVELSFAVGLVAAVVADIVAGIVVDIVADNAAVVVVKISAVTLSVAEGSFIVLKALQMTSQLHSMTGFLRTYGTYYGRRNFMKNLYLVEPPIEPKYGFGLECSSELALRDDVDTLFTEISSIEIIPESFFQNKRADFIKRLGESQQPVIGHCVELSLGSDEPLDRKHLDETKAVLDKVNCVIFSDHLCMTRASGIEIGQLTTLPFTQKVSDVVARKVDQIQKEFSQPFMIENITNRFIYPGNDLEEPHFINEVTRKTGCGHLLDITNLYINSVNFKFDPYKWIDKLNSKAVMGIHLAGGVKEGGVLYDTHSRMVPKPVWDLLAYVLKKSRPDVIIIEWDQHMPETARLIEECHYGEDFLESLNERHIKNKFSKLTRAEVRV